MRYARFAAALLFAGALAAGSPLAPGNPKRFVFTKT